jgi:proteasome lid subunit RPN8/RPN11
VEQIIFPRRLADHILQHALSSPELEVCGLIAGRNGRPLRAIPVRNVADQPQRLFTMDPAGQIDAQRGMRERGEELFAIYHSHPHGPAHPSPTDLEQAAYPRALYLVVSLDSRDTPQLRGFRLDDGRPRQVNLRFQEAPP